MMAVNKGLIGLRAADSRQSGSRGPYGLSEEWIKVQRPEEEGAASLVEISTYGSIVQSKVIS
jgi:hypothetical protein